MTSAGNLTELTAIELRDRIASGDVSAEQAARAYLDAIAAREPAVRAYNEVWADRALEQAGAIDARRAAGQDIGPLGGVPLAVKDNMCTLYGRTTCSSKILADFRAPYQATAVDKLEKQVLKLVVEMSRIVTLTDRVRRDLQIRAVMQVWLYFHVPLSFALLAALIAHVISVFYFW